MRHLVTFDISGKDQAELEAAAERILARFARGGWSVDYSLDVSAGPVTQQSDEPISWRARVEAVVTPADTRGGGSA
jgi:hypothetical protein